MLRKNGRRYDIADVLKKWDYDLRQEMMVRRIIGKDGMPKIQMRLDLGILQMEERGRPDGKRPHGKESLLNYYEGIASWMKKKYGTTSDFSLDKDDCYALQQEGIQYYYRYLCFFQLADFKKAERDTSRNLRLFDFAKKYAADEKYIDEFEQYRPYVIMMNTRAKVLGALKAKDATRAVDEINHGIHKIEDVYGQKGSKPEQGSEINFLKNWAEEIVKSYTPTRKQKLVEELNMALENEDYEKAAKIRDRLKKME
jgi:hypothetical protein